MEINSDFSDLLSLLGRHRVRYLIVGGWAVVYHTEPRYTKDLDVYVDILKAIDGVRFETAWKNRTRVSFGSVRVNLIGRRDLIRNKRASGRPRDLLDLEALTSRAR